MKILLYLVQLHQLRMESHLLPLMLNTLPTLVERRRDVKEIENVNMVVVVAIGTGTGIETETGIIGIGNVVIVIGLESQMTITTSNHGRGSMHEMTITSIEAMISMPNLDGMKMSIVLGIVIVMSAIGIGNPDLRGRETGNPGRTGTGREIETETGRETEETETEEEGEEEEGKTEETGETEETGREKGIETGIETERGETKTEETGKENEETGTERKIERNLIIHIPRHIMKARHLRRQQVGTLLDPSSKKCLLLTLTAMVLYLNIQKQMQELDLVGYSFYFSFTFESLCLLSN